MPIEAEIRAKVHDSHFGQQPKVRLMPPRSDFGQLPNVRWGQLPNYKYNHEVKDKREAWPRSLRARAATTSHRHRKPSPAERTPLAYRGDFYAA